MVELNKVVGRKNRYTNDKYNTYWQKNVPSIILWFLFIFIYINLHLYLICIDIVDSKSV